jgi:hypothetical protein
MIWGVSETRKINLRLPPDLHAALTQSAQADDRSVNRQINAILRAALTARGYMPTTANTPQDGTR